MKHHLLIIVVVATLVMLSFDITQAQPATPHWVQITQGPLHIRECASTSCAVISDPIRPKLIREIPEGGRAKVIETVQALDEKGCIESNCTWYHIDDGYIHSFYTVGLDDPTPLQTNPCPEENVCVVVDLPTQSIHLFQNGAETFATWVSTGYREGLTPVGSHRIWAKVRIQTMRGGQGAFAYILPEIKWVSYFTYRGVSLHSTYWHYWYGTVGRSHGCVNMTATDAAAIFNVVGEGTLVVVQ